MSTQRLIVTMYSAVLVFGLILSANTLSIGAEEAMTNDATPPDVETMADDSAMPMTGALDGKTFAGEMGEKGKEAAGKDTFIFKDGTFRSTACDAYGFDAGAYQAATDGDITTFHAQTVSPTDGTNMWMGTVMGDTIEGTFTWTKPDQTSIEHWFKGQLQQ